MIRPAFVHAHCLCTRTRFDLSKLLLTLVIVLGLGTQASAQNARFVDDGAPPGGDGLSWATAFRHLQDALSAASAGGIDELRIAAGTYCPDQGVGFTPGDRNASFHLLNNLAVRGGYAGLGAADPDARDPAVFVTTLSGDLAENDQPNWVNHSENSEHIVTAIAVGPTANLDGVTLYGGYASAVNNAGAGLYSQSAGPTIVNCVISECLAFLGGGILIYGGAPNFRDCRVNGNYAWSGRGGGLYVVSGGSPALSNCRFVNNQSHGGGGVGDGGAIFIEFDAPVTLIDCLFLNNTSTGSSPSYANGGAICSLGAGLTAINCRFLHNSALVGGAVWVGRSSTFVNCLFTGNTSLVGGGMIAFNTPVTVTNCVLAGNNAPDGGGIALGFNAAATVTNSILWSNLSSGAPSLYKAQIHKLDDTASITLSYSCVQGVFTPEPGEDPPDPANFPGCTEANPLLVDANGADNIFGTEDDDVHVQPGSPCIDAGKNSAVPPDAFDLDADANTTEPLPFDLGGAARFADDPAAPNVGLGTPPLVDMGVYERPPPAVAGDLNCDGQLDFNDVAPFALALVDPAAYEAQYPACDRMRADMSTDGAIDGHDVPPMVTALLAP